MRPFGCESNVGSSTLGDERIGRRSRLRKTQAEYIKLFGSEDFFEGRKAEAENRPPYSTADEHFDTPDNQNILS